MEKDCYTRFVERMEKSTLPKKPTGSRRINYFLRNRRFMILLIFIVSFSFYYTFWHHTRNFDAIFSSFAHSACNIPDIDPYDRSIATYILQPDPIHCNVSGDLVFLDSRGLVRFNQTAMAEVEKNRGKVRCKYQIVKRVNGSDDDVIYGEQYNLQDFYQVKADFFKVQCHASDKTLVYDNVLSSIYRQSHKKNDVVDRAVNESQHMPYSVLIFGLDSVSRLNAVRKLKKTLKIIINEMNGYMFRGYTKIGDNTFPNLVPMFTGKHPEHVPPELPDRRGFVDSYPILWKDFKKRGYVTNFAEDLPDLSVFNYKGKGFLSVPTDHYMRPFWLAASKDNPINTVLGPFWLALENKKIHIGHSSTLCYGSTMRHMKVIDYVKRFFEKYADLPRFSFSWLTEISHDHLNTVQLCDDDIYTLIKTLRRTADLDNAFVFVLSDHGNRFDAIRSTLIGRIEERMPLITMTIPKRLRRQFPDLHRILSENQNRLTNPYDVFETLKDILYATYDPATKAARVRLTPNIERRGISLFEAIPKDRSCESAHIPEGYCACYKSDAANVTNSNIIAMGKYIIDRINALTNPYRQKCVTFRYKTVRDAQRVHSGLDIVPKKPSWFGWLNWDSSATGVVEKFLVVVEATPSGALFEATVNYRHVSKSVELISDINRINRYGNQSNCMDIIKLKLYCFCKET